MFFISLSLDLLGFKWLKFPCLVCHSKPTCWIFFVWMDWLFLGLLDSRWKLERRGAYLAWVLGNKVVRSSEGRSTLVYKGFCSVVMRVYLMKTFFDSVSKLFRSNINNRLVLLRRILRVNILLDLSSLNSIVEILSIYWIAWISWWIWSSLLNLNICKFFLSKSFINKILNILT